MLHKFFLIICLHLLTTLSCLPEEFVNFIESGYDAYIYKNAHGNKFKLFDLSDTSNEYQILGHNYNISKLLKVTAVNEKNSNPTVGIYNTYRDFFQSFTKDIKVNMGFPIKDVTLGMGFGQKMNKTKELLDSQKKAAGLSEEIQSLYSVNLLPAFMVP
jgi:hypothetical protein